MEEIWKNIEGYPNYMVSNLGKVKSLGNNKTRKEKIMKLCNTGNGYLAVNLCKNGKEKTYLVHRLVAEAFIPNPNNYSQINHKDENKQNNFVYINEDGTVDLEKSNIEWCTAKYNMNYGTRSKRQGEEMINHPSNSKPVLQIDKNTNEVIAEFPSTMEVKRQLGFAFTNISECCLGKRKTCGGFKWKYA